MSRPPNKALQTDKDKLSCLCIRKRHASSPSPMSLLVRRHLEQARAFGGMRDSIARLLDHYATVTDGTSALLREDLVSIYRQHSVSGSEFCEAFALALARRYVDGRLDADGAAFAVDDLHVALDFTLTPFARRLFDLLEYREASPAEIQQILEEHGHGAAV